MKMPPVVGYGYFLESPIQEFFENQNEPTTEKKKKRKNGGEKIK